jgi:hypothetical protein
VRSASKSVCSIASLLLVLGTVSSQGAGAADDSIIQRCEADDGNAVYTDKPCAQFQARPTRVSDDLAIRLAMAEAAEAAATPALSLGPYRDASEPLEPQPTLATGRRSPASGCAQSPQQLSRDLVGAFALHDVNRVAESYHWVGMNQRQALPVMKQLERLSSQSLADARYLGAWIASADAGVRPMPTDAGLMQLVFADGPRIINFSVRRYSGCYFIAS